MKESNNIISTQSKEEKNQKSGLMIKNKYIINQKHLLGKGSFGKIYSGIDKTTDEEVAIKLEQNGEDQPQLIYENKIYKLLQGGYGFPKIYDFTKEHNYNILVMEMLGNSIENIFIKYKTILRRGAYIPTKKNLVY